MLQFNVEATASLALSAAHTPPGEGQSLVLFINRSFKFTDVFNNKKVTRSEVAYGPKQHRIIVYRSALTEYNRAVSMNHFAFLEKYRWLLH